MDNDPLHRVLIVGCGISALSAAHRLLQKSPNLQILIVESRERIGGRTITYVDEESDIVVDLGASWIHGHEGNPLVELAQQYGSQLGQPDDSDDEDEEVEATVPLMNEYTGFFDEENVDVKEIAAFMDREVILFLDEMAKSKASQLENDMSMREALEHFGGTKEFFDRVKQKFNVQDDKVLQRVFALCASSLEGFNGAPLELISAKHYFAAYEPFPGGDRYVIGGYSKIIQGLHNAIIATGRVQVLLNHSVSTISFDAKSNTCTVSGSIANQNGKEFCYAGQCVLITVPLGVLKANKIKFDPPLPDWKASCIQRMGMGMLEKVVLIFDHIFWNKTHDWIGFASENQPLNWFLNLTHFAEADKPALVAFCTKGAPQIATKTDDEILQMALNVLATGYGNQVFKSFKRGVVTKWITDPFSLGSYSFLAKGSTPSDFETLGLPVKDHNLFFAGEATAREHYGTAHAAYISGQREADRIIQHLATYA